MKNHLSICLPFIFLSLVTQVSAQQNQFEVGVIGGVGYSGYIGEQSELVYKEPSSPLAFTVGLSGQWNVSSMLSLAANFSYEKVQSTVVLVHNDPQVFQPIPFDYKATIQRITVPLLAKFYFGKQNFYGLIGPQINLLLDRTDYADLTWTLPGLPPESGCYEGPYTYNTTEAEQRVNFAAIVGLGYSRDLTENIGLELELRGTFDFSDTAIYPPCEAPDSFGNCFKIYLLLGFSYGL